MPKLKGSKLVKSWRRFQLDSPGATQKEHAESLGIPYRAYKSRYFRATEKQKQLSRDLFHIDIGQPWVLPAGDYCIVGDVHAPSTNVDFATLALDVAKSEGVTDLVIAGDLFNMDYFSRYSSFVEHPTWKQELKAVKKLLKFYTEYFENIYIIMGNHDRRFQKYMCGTLGHDDLLTLLNQPKKVKLSNFGHCIIKSSSGGADWRITHPVNYSINQLVVADQLAQKFHQNIMSFHEHHLAKGWDRYGNYVIVNGGGLFDVNSIAYTQLDDSKSAAMKNGFVMLINDTPKLYGEEPYTDWGELI